jgi:NAD(P)-dependent dehydrogenase (short-subunit alcohol dehydrogenase family)
VEGAVTHALMTTRLTDRSGASLGDALGLVERVEVEGWMESLHAEVEPFGITTTVVNPRFFRTELLTEQSTNYAEPSIADYLAAGPVPPRPAGAVPPRPPTAGNSDTSLSSRSATDWLRVSNTIACGSSFV